MSHKRRIYTMSLHIWSERQVCMGVNKGMYGTLGLIGPTNMHGTMRVENLVLWEIWS